MTSDQLGAADMVLTALAAIGGILKHAASENDTLVQDDMIEGARMIADSASRKLRAVLPDRRAI